MKSGIEFEIVWFDQDVVEIRVSSSNSRFSGQANLYLGRGCLSETADRLQGFPSNSADSRDFELGTFNPNHAGGGVRMHFYCLDMAGHAAVDVRLRLEACKTMGEVGSVALRIPVEAAAVDSFAMRVRAMDEEQIGASAYLESAD
jgi:hypothetical protein